MADVIQTRSTSRNTALASDIVLRDLERVRLLFRPLIVNNPNNPTERVKGTFIYQKRTKSGDWEDYSEGSVQQLKPGEGISLELKSSELLKFIQEVHKVYELAEQHGVLQGEHKFAVTNSNISGIIEQIVKNPGYLNQVIEKNGWEFFRQSLEWLARNIASEEDQKRLLGLSKKSLGQLDSALSMAKMQSTIDLLEKSLAIKDEEHWQSLFKTDPWLLSQLFPYPVALFRQKAYVGGKAIDNTHGNVVDFLYRNKLTENSVLIEIKHPGIPLLGGRYRGNSYSISSELTGGISQLLSYRDSLMKDSAQLLARTKEDLRVYYPKCVLVIGSYAQLNGDEDKVATFERFRANLNWLEIVTFDELLNRIKSLVDILKPNTSEFTPPPSPEDDFPF